MTVRRRPGGEGFSEAGAIRLPPKPMPKSEYPAYNKKRSQKDMFWFIEYTVNGRCATIREDGWKYCFYNGDMEELYNYEKDPIELHNLATKPEHQARKAAMKKKLFAQGFVGVNEAADNKGSIRKSVKGDASAK